MDPKELKGIQGQFFNNTFGAVFNSLTVKYKINSGDYVEVQPDVEENRDQYLAIVELEGLSHESSHTITVSVSDKLETVEKEVSVSKGIPVFDWGESDFQFNVPVYANEGLHVQGKTLLDFFYPTGTIYTNQYEADPAELFGGTWEALASDGSAGYKWKRTK